MKFEKCLSCEQCGKSCRPDFMAMQTTDLLEWIDRYQKLHGISNVALAQKSGVPKGTIDGIKAGKRADIRHETLRPIISALIGDAGEVCQTTAEVNDSRIAALELENEKLKATKETLEHELKMAERIDALQERNTDRLDRILKARMVAIYGLVAICATLGITLIDYIRIDASMPDVGHIISGKVSPFMIAIIVLIVCFVATITIASRKTKKQPRKDEKDYE